MKMISICNKKGVVGKTTLCKNIAYKLALENKKVLLIDLDPQATITMQVNNDVKNDKCILDIIASKSAVKLIKIINLIERTKYKNIDIIMANEELNKISATINATYSEKEKYLLSDIIYQNNQEIFENYDYVLIDYPPTINELSVSFLMLSDVIIVPINEGLNSIKGLMDLQNTLNHFCREKQKNIPNIKILLNGIKEGKNLKQILNLLNEKKLNNLSKSKISYSETFKTIENNLNSIWTNPYYWRQKQAYEELIAEII
ncbi:ParA family protein [Spiroplasma endosymbiont of Zeiraphera isertana]|uniref:ParA family protein n=1 Tax=Spiroplasma endosymbiont of Zeiraphera isertana TaxID=3066313 RepID=UPI00313C9455